MSASVAEINARMQPLTRQILIENRRAFRQRHGVLAARLAGDRMMAALDRLESLLASKEFDPDQPRAPAGSPEGGQWIGIDDYAQDLDSEAPIILANSPGIGHNGGPSLDEPPIISQQDPGDPRSRLEKAKEVAKWLAVFGFRGLSPVAKVLAAVETAQWLHAEWPSIRSYQDEPKSMEDLISGAQEARPRYHRHHIVEQTPARDDGFPRAMIDGVDNVVSVPIYRHRQISGWYQSPSADFGGLSPRDYLRGKEWSERVRVGQEAMRRFGVLKP